jgi:hypothetical protein
VDEPARKLEAALGRPLPDDAKPSKAYSGPPRLIVPTVRSLAVSGEALRLKVIALDKQPVKSVTLCRRPLGRGDFQRIAAEHVARAVYAVVVPPLTGDIEYYLESEAADGRKLIWPATAPDLNQTVVVLDVGSQ